MQRGESCRTGVAEFEHLNAAHGCFPEAFGRRVADRLKIADDFLDADRAVVVGGGDDGIARGDIRHAAIERQARACEAKEILG